MVIITECKWTVHIPLDSFFDEPKKRPSNRVRVNYLNLMAANEGLDRIAATGNPTGGDVSQQLTLAVVLLVNVHAVYDGLMGVFLHDWALRTR